MADCKHEFVWDELHQCIRCKNCFRVLTREEKRELLERANAMRKEEEVGARSSWGTPMEDAHG